MFSWICPECGHECAPTDEECPICGPTAVARKATLQAEGPAVVPGPAVALAEPPAPAPVVHAAEPMHAPRNGHTAESAPVVAKLEPAPLGAFVPPVAPPPTSPQPAAAPHALAAALPESTVEPVGIAPVSPEAVAVATEHEEMAEEVPLPDFEEALLLAVPEAAVEHAAPPFQNDLIASDPAVNGAIRAQDSAGHATPSQAMEGPLQESLTPAIGTLSGGRSTATAPVFAPRLSGRVSMPDASVEPLGSTLPSPILLETEMLPATPSAQVPSAPHFALETPRVLLEMPVAPAVEVAPPETPVAPIQPGQALTQVLAFGDAKPQTTSDATLPEIALPIMPEPPAFDMELTMRDPQPLVSPEVPLAAEPTQSPVPKVIPAIADSPTVSEAISFESFLAKAAVNKPTPPPTPPPPALPAPMSAPPMGGSMDSPTTLMPLPLFHAPSVEAHVEELQHTESSVDDEPKLMDPKQLLAQSGGLPEISSSDLAFTHGAPALGTPEPPIYVGDRWESPYDLVNRVQTPAKSASPAAAPPAPPKSAIPPDEWAAALQALDQKAARRTTDSTRIPPPEQPGEAGVSALLEPLPELPANHWSKQPITSELDLAPKAVAVPAPAATPAARASEPVAPTLSKPITQAVETVADAPKKSKSSPVQGLVLVALVLATFAGAWFAMPFLLGNNSAAPVNSWDGGVAAVSMKPHKLASSLEIVGFRIKHNPGGNAQVKFIVVNHSEALIGDLRMNLVLDSGSGKTVKKISEFAVAVPQLGPYESSEVTVAVKTDGSQTEYDWAQLRPKFDITSN